jgi:hypothetical protein
MALVTGFEPKELAHASAQKPVEASYSSVEIGGERFFQIDTYGSAERQMVGKRSQSIRLNRQAAEQLISLLKQEFSL